MQLNTYKDRGIESEMILQVHLRVEYSSYPCTNYISAALVICINTSSVNSYIGTSSAWLLDLFWQLVSLVRLVLAPNLARVNGRECNIYSRLLKASASPGRGHLSIPFLRKYLES